jgi:spermidine/putrescine transport system permease protein
MSAATNASQAIHAKSAEAARRRRRPFDWRYNPGFGPFTLLVMLFLYTPLVVLVIFAFNANRLVTIWSGFSFKWFVAIANNGDIRHAAYISILVGVLATICSTAIAIAAALGFERGGWFRGRGSAIGLVTMPLVVPEIVTAITTLIFFSAIGFHSGVLNLVIAHTVFCIPFAMLPIQARLNTLGAGYEEAARDLYGSEWRIFLRITLPLMSPGIMAGAILAFVTSLDDFLISFMVSSAGSTTLPVYVYGMMRLGVTPEVNAISAVLLVISAALALVAFIISRPSEAATAAAAGTPQTAAAL